MTTSCEFRCEFLFTAYETSCEFLFTANNHKKEYFQDSSQSVSLQTNSRIILIVNKNSQRNSQLVATTPSFRAAN